MSRKIAMINTVGNGSHGRIMTDLAAAARQEGHTVRLFFGRGEGGFGSDLGTRLHGVGTRLLDQHGLGSKKDTARLLQEISDFKPDMVHLHNAHGYYLNVPMLFDFLRALKIPLVWTLHDCWAMTGHCSHFYRAGCDRYITRCHDCPLKGEYPASLLLDGSKRNWQWKKKVFTPLPSSVVVPASHWLESVVQNSILSAWDCHTIPNGVDLSLFQPGVAMDTKAKLGIGTHQAMLLSVAAPFDERKGFSDLLRLSELAGERARLVLVGLTPRQLGSLPRGVIGIARTDGPEALVHLYQAADCYVNASYEETYPTVNMEAIACGTPVACYQEGGATEQITPDVGRLVSCGNVEELLDAALTLSAQKPAMSDACRTAAEARFDRKKATAAYIRLYHSIFKEDTPHATA